LKEKDLLDYFWPIVILSHLHHLFGGTKVGDIMFDLFPGLEEVAWRIATLHKKYDSLQAAYQLLLDTTNRAFGNKTQSTIFLLDEINPLATSLTRIPKSSVITQRHTQLSYVLDKLQSITEEFAPPLCICAGTTNGKLELVSDGTRVTVVPLYLSVLSMEGVFKFGKNYFDSVLNTKEKKYTFQWPDSLESMHQDHLLITIVYYTCQVPRLLKIGIEQWTQKEEFLSTTILDLFYKEATLYYQEAANSILAYESNEFAHLILACNVRLSGLPLVPGTSLEWDALVQQSVVVPYYLESGSPESYTIPPVFWLDLAVSLQKGLMRSHLIFEYLESKRE